MGADLYQMGVYEKQKEKYEPLFKQAVENRNNGKTQADKDYFQKLVEKYYDLMHAEGYFRDSYNHSNLLHLFGLDYWVWFAKLLNKQGNLTPIKAKEVLKELQVRETVFEEALKQFPEEVNNDDLDQKYFREKYTKFKGFLKAAIEAKTPIECSI